MWFRKELASRLIPGSTEFREAVAKEVEAVEQRHTQRHSEMEQKLVDARHQYATLEHEFRMALTIEANRFSEVESRATSEVRSVQTPNIIYWTCGSGKGCFTYCV